MTNIDVSSVDIERVVCNKWCVCVSPKTCVSWNIKYSVLALCVCVCVCPKTCVSWSIQYSVLALLHNSWFVVTSWEKVSYHLNYQCNEFFVVSGVGRKRVDCMCMPLQLMTSSLIAATVVSTTKKRLAPVQELRSIQAKYIQAVICLSNNNLINLHSLSFSLIPIEEKWNTRPFERRDNIQYLAKQTYWMDCDKWHISLVCHLTVTNLQ